MSSRGYNVFGNSFRGFPGKVLGLPEGRGEQLDSQAGLKKGRAQKIIDPLFTSAPTWKKCEEGTQKVVPGRPGQPVGTRMAPDDKLVSVLLPHCWERGWNLSNEMRGAYFQGTKRTSPIHHQSL